MINIQHAYAYCKEDISKIENYKLAIEDKSQTWVVHHRDEVKILPSGIKVFRSKEELMEIGRYYNCPANELIFMTRKEHASLHNKGVHKSDEHKNKIGKSNKGKIYSNETREKMSLAKKEAYLGEGNPFYGKHHSDETKEKISNKAKGRTPWNKGNHNH